MDGITYINSFIEEHSSLYKLLETTVEWDTRMKARKTASFGKAYDYSQISYPFQEFTDELNSLVSAIGNVLHFTPNNCLINFYTDGSSSMGYHSDQTDILAENTGVVIVSLGETRTLRFRSIENKDEKVDFQLPSGSLIYMTNAVQEKWQHAIPKANTVSGRMSLTFRNLK